jgi:hypothetical protein
MEDFCFSERYLSLLKLSVPKFLKADDPRTTSGRQQKEIEMLCPHIEGKCILFVHKLTCDLHNKLLIILVIIIMGVC